MIHTDWQQRITPDRVTSLAPGQVFVFGSNIRGIHGAGAALDARRLFGAQTGCPEGFTGRCYSLPTKLSPSASLDLADVGQFVRRFINCASTFTKQTFLVTAVGCGRAGFWAVLRGEVQP